MKLCRRSLAAPCLGEPALVILAVWLIHHQADRLDQALWAAHESTVDQRQVMAQKEVEALARHAELICGPKVHPTQPQRLDQPLAEEELSR